MQKLSVILKIDPTGVKVTDEFGYELKKPLEIVIGTAVEFSFDLRTDKISSETSALLPLDPVLFQSCSSFFFAIDRDFDHNTSPLLFKTDGICAETADQYTRIRVPVANTAVESLVKALGSSKSAEFSCEIAGIDSEGTACFSWIFPVVVRNRIFLGDCRVPDSVISDPEYLNAVQVRALVASQSVLAAQQEAEKHIPVIGENGNWFTNGSDSGIAASAPRTQIQYSANGSANSWHDILAGTDHFIRFVF
jgi:hypothetical protein